MNLNNADSIKAGFISQTLEKKMPLFQEPITALGQEVMFGVNNSFADLIIIYNNKLYAIEIKALRDNLKRLDAQLQNYQKVFDYVYLLATDNHLKSLELERYDRIGFIEVNENGFNVVKRALIQKSFSKEDILGTMPYSFLSTKYVFKKGTTAVSARQSLIRKSQKVLKNLLLEYMKNKIVYKYQNFLAEKGDTFQYEDISILSLMNFSVLK